MPLSPAFNPKGYKARLLNPYVLELYYETPGSRHSMQFDFFTRTMTVSDADGIKGVKAFEELSNDVIRDMRYGLERLGGKASSATDRDKLFDATAAEMTKPANDDAAAKPQLMLPGPRTTEPTAAPDIPGLPNPPRIKPLERTADGRYVWRP